MPLYAYFCNEDAHHEGCGHEFEEQLNIEDRMLPMNDPCPKCKKRDQICRKFSVNLHTGVINPGQKMESDFKETMKRIHKEHPEAKSSYF